MLEGLNKEEKDRLRYIAVKGDTWLDYFKQLCTGQRENEITAQITQ